MFYLKKDDQENYYILPQRVWMEQENRPSKSFIAVVSPSSPPVIEDLFNEAFCIDRPLIGLSEG